MYLYSIIIFGLVCYLGPHIRRQSPLQNLALAWIYILDTLINAAYTTLFGLTWFIILAKHLSPNGKDAEAPLDALPGGKTINDTAGFTDPEATVNRVEVITSPSGAGAVAGQDAVAHGVIGTGGSTFGSVIFESGSIMSIIIISSLWFIRIYFVVIVMSYARGVLRQAIAASPPQNSSATSPTAVTTDSTDGNPFHASLPAGQGWKGKLGRILVSFPRNYWLSKDEVDDEWARGADERFRRQNPNRGPVIKNPPPSKGTSERERRARSGTGPPPPAADVRIPLKRGEGSGSSIEL